MRFVRVVAGMLLLVIGIPALFAGGALWLVTRHADPGGLLAVGVLLVACAVLLLLRPLRPREVVFVVEPDQVPVLAGRLGVSSLSGLRARPADDGDPARPLPAERQLTSVGSGVGERQFASVASGAGERSRSALGAVRPATLADLETPPRMPGPPQVTLSLAWPPAAPGPTPRPVVVDETASGPPRCRHGGPPSPGDRCYPSDA
ncbi:hypothetical protein V6V47_08410 [Micromonospora sp. CPCC 205539]|uniref:hypothetical protein n=1 Tax=Micromonospora sp. CPCC 205539 TaxID=3122408 RepID=UPI002FF108E8